MRQCFHNMLSLGVLMLINATLTATMAFTP